MAKQFLPIFLILGYPLFSICILKYYRNRLEDPEIKDRWGGFYDKINLTKHSWNYLYYPIFLVRRIIFVGIPLSLNRFSAHQIQTVVCLNFALCAYYYNCKPHSEGKLKTGVEMFNEFMVLILTYHMLFYSDWMG